MTPLQAVLRYRDLLQVENLFLRTKAIMRTRPIFHSSDAAIRGHVFCSFLALAMQKHLDDLSCEAGVMLEWRQMLRDLDRLQQARLRHHGADWLLRTDATPMITGLFRHAHIALPPRARQTAPPKAAPASKSAQKRRGRPAVVPRRLEFRRNPHEIKNLSGVQVGSSSQLRCRLEGDRDKGDPLPISSGRAERRKGRRMNPIAPKP